MFINFPSISNQLSDTLFCFFFSISLGHILLISALNFVISFFLFVQFALFVLVFSYVGSVNDYIFFFDYVYVYECGNMHIQVEVTGQPQVLPAGQLAAAFTWLRGLTSSTHYAQHALY